MKKTLSTAIVIALTAGSSGHALVTSLNDLNYWGTGSNRTGFAVFWNDGENPGGLAWGYNWSGSGVTVDDMLIELAALDPNLYFRIDSSTNASGDTAVFGIGYDNTGTFGVTGAEDVSGNPTVPVFSLGISDMNIDPEATDSPSSSATAGPNVVSNRYTEGWNDTGFWGLVNSGTDNFALEASVSYPTSWTDAFVGVSSLELVNDSWVAFSFAPGFSGVSPVGRSADLTAAVPEPSAFPLLAGLAATWFVFARRRFRK